MGLISWVNQRESGSTSKTKRTPFTQRARQRAPWLVGRHPRTWLVRPRTEGHKEPRALVHISINPRSLNSSPKENKSNASSLGGDAPFERMLHQALTTLIGSCARCPNAATTERCQLTTAVEMSVMKWGSRGQKVESRSRITALNLREGRVARLLRQHLLVGARAAGERPRRRQPSTMPRFQRQGSELGAFVGLAPTPMKPNTLAAVQEQTPDTKEKAAGRAVARPLSRGTRRSDRSHRLSSVQTGADGRRSATSVARRGRRRSRYGVLGRCFRC